MIDAFESPDLDADEDDEPSGGAVCYRVSSTFNTSQTGGEYVSLPPEEQAAIHEQLSRDRERREAWLKARECENEQGGLASVTSITGRDGKQYPTRNLKREARENRSFIEKLDNDLRDLRYYARRVENKCRKTEFAVHLDEVRRVKKILSEVQNNIERILTSHAPEQPGLFDRGGVE